MSMQAIVTRFIPCTNYRPSRVKAVAEAGSVTLSWEHGLNSDGNHAKAAKALADKFKWSGTWYAGGMANGYVFVNVANYKGVLNDPDFTTTGRH